MTRHLNAIISLLALTACGSETSVPTSQQGHPEPNAQLTGQAAYEAHCASCHDTGLDDAPVTGSPGDWFERSQLWQAVLMEHARAGYLEMPKRGGNPELSDIEVDAAAEYMLAITYPDRPPDN